MLSNGDRGTKYSFNITPFDNNSNYYLQGKVGITDYDDKSFFKYSNGEFIFYDRTSLQIIKKVIASKSSTLQGQIAKVKILGKTYILVYRKTNNYYSFVFYDHESLNYLFESTPTYHSYNFYIDITNLLVKESNNTFEITVNAIEESIVGVQNILLGVYTSNDNNFNLKVLSIDSSATILLKLKSNLISFQLSEFYSDTQGRNNLGIYLMID